MQITPEELLDLMRRHAETTLINKVPAGQAQAAAEEMSAVVNGLGKESPEKGR